MSDTAKPPAPEGCVIFGPVCIKGNTARWAAITEENGILAWTGDEWLVPWCDAEFAADVLHQAWLDMRARAEKAEAERDDARRLVAGLERDVAKLNGEGVRAGLRVRAAERARDAAIARAEAAEKLAAAKAGTG
jgi:hypothetical protein